VTRRTLNLTDRLQEYVRAHSLREHPALARLGERTAALPDPDMQIAPEQGQFMALLVELIGARRILEIGCFTGYSALWMALALPPDGRLIACDVNKEYTDIAQRYWDEAGVAERIRLRLAPAIETLDDLISSGLTGRFDLAFIDADKPEYPEYYERCLRLLRRGWMFLIYNTLWYGKPADPSEQDDDTRAIRAFNKQLYQDNRIDLSLLPVADGLTLALKS
jgi:predicted O-methyltransferase YrrM